MFVKLQDRRCLVVGGGTIAEGKVRGLLQAGAQVTVVAPRAGAWIREQARAGKLAWQRRQFRPADASGVFLVVAATSSLAVNRDVFRSSAGHGALCNAVDDPEHCDFFYPAVVRRGDLQVAISTNGQSPALARRLRADLERQFGPEYAAWVRRVGVQRREILSRKMTPAARRLELDRIASWEAFQEFLRLRPQSLPRRASPRRSS